MTKSYPKIIPGLVRCFRSWLARPAIRLLGVFEDLARVSVETR